MHVSGKMDLKPAGIGKNVDMRVFLREGRIMLYLVFFLSLFGPNYPTNMHIWVINYWSHKDYE
jgi:hypothetical protein